MCINKRNRLHINQYNGPHIHVVVCAYRSSKELHRQGYLDGVLTGVMECSLGGVMARVLAQSKGDMDSIPAAGLMFFTFTPLVAIA